MIASGVGGVVDEGWRREGYTVRGAGGLKIGGGGGICRRGVGE